MTKLIIFDWDDVFTHGSTEGYYACYKAAVDSVAPGIDLEIIKQAVKDLWGRPAKDVLARILGDKKDLIEQAHEEYERCLFSEVFLSKLSFIEGGLELLHRLANKYELAIATGIHPILLKEYVMPKFNVPKELFRKIISSYDLADQSKGKPYPDLLEIILKDQDISSDEAVMVGDALGDVKMALAARTRPIVVLTGHLTKEQATSLGVKDVIATVTDLESILE